MSEPETPTPHQAHPLVGRRVLPLLLLLLTIASTTYVGGFWSGNATLVDALTFSAPLMAILLAHEFGHYIAARIHRVPASLPFFIPLPFPPLGTMGAVILMPGEIKSRNALLDIGAAGPLAGLVVALPVLVYGIATSEVAPFKPVPNMTMYLEGHSLLYEGLLYALKGPIPAGYDIMLSPTGFAGWAGLLVTMLNLIPALQLDGGHVAHALLGDRQERISKVVRKLLFPLGLGVSLYFGGVAYLAGVRGDALWSEAQVGTQWLVWAVLLHFMARRGEREHPATEGEPLSPGRKWVAGFTLALFVLLFMPAWLRVMAPS